MNDFIFKLGLWMIVVIMVTIWWIGLFHLFGVELWVAH